MKRLALCWLIVFSFPCLAEQRVQIAAIGDVLLHKPLQVQGYAKGFMDLWQQAVPYLQQADITFANLEGPIALGVRKNGQTIPDPGLVYDDNVHSSYPLFNSHPVVAKALKLSGVDIVGFANNHSLDRYSIGVDRTIDALQENKLAVIGAKRKGHDQPNYTIIEKKGIRIAWLACTMDTNGIKDKHDQISYCYRDRKEILAQVNQLRDQVDAVMVSPHWGVQYQHTPSRQQTMWAHQVLDAGALAIIGSHPHVIQPMKNYRTQDGRDTFIAYSLGNFVSNQGSIKNRTTVILLLELVKQNGKTVIARTQYVPFFMQNRRGKNRSELIRLTPRKVAPANHLLRRMLPTVTRSS